MALRIDAILRVDQAGEYGATRIYEGQIAALKNSKATPILQEMLSQEQEHLQAFNQLLVERNVRPTFLQPLWHVGGFALGYLTALMGEKAAHACTIAVEEVIEDHYQQQLKELGPNHTEVATLIERCCADEVHHKHIAEQHGGTEVTGFAVLSTVVKTISRAAIWLSKRI